MLIKTIALDGPAGCGKSTLGKNLANTLDFLFLDTGLLYRAIARHAMNVDVKIYEEDAIRDYAQALTLTIEQLRPKFKFKLNNTTVTDLYSLQIDKVVPIIAAYPDVRLQVRKIQRQIASAGQIILAGRDIGTVVLPNADLKIYLEVSLEERAQRRYHAQNTNNRTLDQIRADLKLRDELDTKRDISPMTIADDAIILCTDSMSPQEVVSSVMDHISMSDR